MPEKYDLIANFGKSGSESDGQENAGFAFNQGMSNAVEVRQMQIADPWLALNVMATPKPGRVLDLLKIGSVGVA